MKISSRKEVLVTGALGFIGSNLMLDLADQGFHPLGMDLEVGTDEVRNLRSKRLRDRGLDVMLCDLKDKSQVINTVRNARPNLIVHLAARAGVRDSFKNPADYFETNVTGTLNLMEAASGIQVQHIFLASSSSVFGEQGSETPSSENVRIDEVISPYAASKASMELASKTAFSGELDVTQMRFFTVFGPMGRPDMAVWKFTRSLMRGDEIEVYGTGSERRDFTPISSLTRKICHLLNLESSVLKGLSTLNLGCGAPTTVADLIANLAGRLGVQPRIQYGDPKLGDVAGTWSSTGLQESLGLLDQADEFELGIDEWVNWAISNSRLVCEN